MNKDVKNEQTIIGKFLGWFFGGLLCLCIFTIFDKETKWVGFYFTIIGLLLLPPINIKLRNKYIKFVKKYYGEKYSIKIINFGYTAIKIGFAFIVLVMLSIFNAPNSTIAYTKDDVILCSKPDAKSGIKKIKNLTEIQVYKDNYKKNGFLKTAEDKYIKENSVVYPNTDEYKKLLTEKERLEREKKAKEKLIESEIKKIQTELENELAKNIKNVFKYYDLTESRFEYFIEPHVWFSVDVKQKENIMTNCAIYGKLNKKQYDLTTEVALSMTKIKSSSNGEILGEYSVWSGFKFK